MQKVQVCQQLQECSWRLASLVCLHTPATQRPTVLQSLASCLESPLPLRFFLCQHYLTRRWLRDFHRSNGARECVVCPDHQCPSTGTQHFCTARFPCWIQLLEWYSQSRSFWVCKGWWSCQRRQGRGGGCEHLFWIIQIWSRLKWVSCPLIVLFKFSFDYTFNVKGFT